MTRVNRMYMLLPIVLLLSVNSFDISLEMWQNECPFSNLCTIESLEKINETADPTLQPCCPSCSCDKDCFVFENCCPDVRTMPPVDLQKANCTELKIENDFAGYVYTDEYRVIDFCPRDYDVIDQKLVDQCEEKYIDDLNDVVAVSDTKNRIYRNKYCALCQGVRDFVSDSFRKTTVSASQGTKSILNQCVLHSVPPDDDGQYGTMQCGDALISSCTSTTNVSDVIREGCLNGPYLPFTHMWFYNEIMLFKNVFCYLCSGEEIERHLCTRPDGIMANGSDISSGILLNLQLGTTNQPEARSETQFQCAETEIYDHVKGNCSRVFCPPYHVVFFGRCLELGKFINHGTKLRIIQSKPNDSIILPTRLMMYEEEASQAYVRNVSLEYGLERCYVASFILEAFFDRKTDTLAAIETTIDIVFDDKCNSTYISHIARTRLSERHDTSVVINNIKVTLTGQITFYDQSFVLLYTSALYESWLMIYFERDEFFFGSDIITNDFFLCPHFIVGIQQYNSINIDVFRDGNERKLTEISDFTSLKNGFYAITNKSIVVCIDTYFEMYANNRGLTTMVAWSLLHGIGLTLTTFLINALVN